jgi:hypothetical protein
MHSSIPPTPANLANGFDDDHVEFMLDGIAEPAEVDPTAVEHMPGPGLRGTLQMHSASGTVHHAAMLEWIDETEPWFASFYAHLHAVGPDGPGTGSITAQISTHKSS